MLKNTLTMSFLKEAPKFELKLDFVEENRGLSQLFDDVSNENKEPLQPATKKAKWICCLLV